MERMGSAAPPRRSHTPSVVSRRRAPAAMAEARMSPDVSPPDGRVEHADARVRAQPLAQRQGKAEPRKAPARNAISAVPPGADALSCANSVMTSSCGPPLFVPEGSRGNRLLARAVRRGNADGSGTVRNLRLDGAGPARSSRASKP